MTSSMQAPDPAASALSSSSDVFSQLMLSSIQSAIINDLEIIGTVTQCSCGSPKCDGGSSIELHESEPSKDESLFGTSDSPPTFLVETRAEAPAFLLSELEISEPSIVTSAVVASVAVASNVSTSVAVTSTVITGTAPTGVEGAVQESAPQQQPQLLPSNMGTKYSAFNPFKTWL